MKTSEELFALKEEVEALNKKLAELSEDELQQVTGSIIPFLVLSPDTALGSTPDSSLPSTDFKGKFKYII